MREEQQLPKAVDVRGTAPPRPRAGGVEATREESVIRSRHKTLPQRDEGKDIPALPGCDAGAAGRIGFVLRELGQLLARWQDRKPAAASPGAKPGPGCSGTRPALAGPSGVRDRAGTR